MDENELAKYIDKQMNIISDLRKDKNISTENWIKHILTLLTGLLTILIAFKSNEVFSYLNHKLFSYTLISIGLSIFSGAVYLYNTIDLLNQTIKFDLESLSKRMRGDNNLHTGVIKPRFLYVFFRYLFYTSSLASLILLISYGIMKN
ncbi:hypothetical protein ACFQ1R_09420 [Mariniflexile jejuense]|uniref:DUF3899 domain-containing protein n=1 Tax=Mariniflexile jejuense TaxID=1173582 RepID=A0ABW3JII7_9FLAO